jgi:hypothetical protein
MENARAPVGSYWTFVYLAARDSVIAVGEAHVTWRAMPEILWLYRMSISPQPTSTMPRFILSNTVSGPISLRL